MNIKDLRKKLGISQQSLADSTGIPKARIGQWEIGNGSPKVGDYEKLNKFFIENGVLKQEEAKPSPPSDELNRERAMIRVLWDRVAKQEAARMGVPVGVALDEMERDTMIAWRDLEKS